MARPRPWTPMEPFTPKAYVSVLGVQSTSSTIASAPFWCARSHDPRPSSSILTVFSCRAAMTPLAAVLDRGADSVRRRTRSRLSRYDPVPRRGRCGDKWGTTARASEWARRHLYAERQMEWFARQPPRKALVRLLPSRGRNVRKGCADYSAFRQRSLLIAHLMCAAIREVTIVGSAGDHDSIPPCVHQ